MAPRPLDPLLGTSHEHEFYCLFYHTSHGSATFTSGGSRISQGAPTRRGMLTNFLAKNLRKLHENELNWMGGGAHPKFYYTDSPLLTHGHFKINLGKVLIFSVVMKLQTRMLSLPCVNKVAGS